MHLVIIYCHLLLPGDEGRLKWENSPLILYVVLGIFLLLSPFGFSEIEKESGFSSLFANKTPPR